MSAIDNSEVTPAGSDETGLNLTHVVNPEARKGRRVLHFSDGTLEESDSDSDVEGRILGASSTDAVGPQSLPVTVTDPKDLSWPSWMWYQSSQGGTKTLNFLDYLGENLAYYLGITSSKYQYEIDEYHRMKQEEEMRTNSNSVELASWASPSTSKQGGTNQVQEPPQPIVTEVVTSNPDVAV